jgi:6-phosphogluconolactonase
MKKNQIQIYQSQTELIEASGDLFIRSVLNSFEEKSLVSVCLSGGSTPLPLYQFLAESKKADQLDWQRIHFFWGDERTVPPDHPDSNYFQAYQALLAVRQVPESNIHRIKGEMDPDEAAKKFQVELLDWFGPTSPPRFDLILLGMGDDGHTASLFPETNLVKDPEEYEWIAANWVPKLNSWRISFTPKLINAAFRVVFLVAGINKAPALAQVLEGSSQPEIYPSQLINPEGELFWLLDTAAASQLRNLNSGSPYDQ